MERVIQNINRLFHGNKRQMLTALALVFIVYVLLLAGIFSYFHSEDTVTNTFESQSMAVKLLEPQWDRIGKNKAKASEPGMTIPKDPYAVNEGQNNLYIRLKVTVSLGQFNSENRSDEYEAEFNDNTRRINSILNVIQFKDGNTFKPLFEWADTDVDIKNRTLKNDCGHPDFYMEKNELNKLNDGTAERVFYFYYIESKDGENSALKAVGPQEHTSVLFDRITIPEFKIDYLGVFDQNYDIAIVAQTIPAEEGESAAVSVQRNKFTE